MGKTFVGIGFGPIQSGLFLLEAIASSNFERLVVVEVVQETVTSVRCSGGRVWVNVAHRNGLSSHELQGLEINNPLDADDVPLIVDAIARADEIATALLSVDFFDRGQPSPAELLARGFERKLAEPGLPRAVVYTAENHNHAAEKLQAAVTRACRAADRPRLSHRAAFLNTVIGKMSGVVSDPAQVARDGLAPLVEGTDRAVLVEEFNRILISRVPFADFQRGITVFQETADLPPFEEAKLYGHNAAHALLGYLANQARLSLMHEADAPLLRFVEQAFRAKSGGALCRRHAGVDPLFTPDGWTEHVDDLMRRMVNPYLRDRVDRITRDPRRKLAWNDRLIGTMRLALAYDIEPRCFVIGAAVATEQLLRDQPDMTIRCLLADQWRAEGVAVGDLNAILRRIEQASPRYILSLSL